MSFIVFNTIAKAESYCKAMSTGHQYECGGDCCWSNRDCFVDNESMKVIQVDEGAYKDEYSGSTNVIGRVKRKP
jgi:hypothetical protein